MLSTSFLEILFDFRNTCLLCSHTDGPSKYDLIIIGHSYLHTYKYQIISHHIKSMLTNIRGYHRPSLKWSQFATSDGILFMFTRHFQHWWHWWQCLSPSACDISDGKSQEWVRQIWLTHYIFFMRLVADNSLNYMHISEINFMSTWFIYTQFCNWHMFKWSYLVRITLFVCSLSVS